jgi:hypothetical protein
VPGSEFWVLYRDGVPAGSVQLQPKVVPEGTHGQIRYFGLTQAAIGHGLGGTLSEHGIAAAWTIPQRHDLPRVTRVWVHTCTLDGPAAHLHPRRPGRTAELPSSRPGHLPHPRHRGHGRQRGH